MAGAVDEIWKSIAFVIEKQQIDGRPTTVAYLMTDFSLAKAKETAELIKVVFQDDHSVIG